MQKKSGKMFTLGRNSLVSLATALLLALTSSVAANPVSAQSASTDTTAETAAPKRGPVTNLPLPRYVSLKASKANVRRGPSRTHRIDWVFTRKSMPLQITAEYGHWRRVRDIEGAGGWIHYSLLSGVRTVIVQKDMLPLAVRPDQTQATAHLELGVIAKLEECTLDWCRLKAGGYKGWVQKTDLWGVSAEEIRD
ncbi:SH3 domain-containing protein [Shimia sp. MMG029]|uniref:SH3 domain-containing protein n=1 Tax=Shimia sp. MMG029 TaxID=3021978 RepID=UPI0022FEB464|nr:SH3 domain-containing protein [Shimia sp. MMG029]MDA5556603.1 SH3 domain-containing protein [Shimia sp. MMG029]